MSLHRTTPTNLPEGSRGPHQAPAPPSKSDLSLTALKERMERFPERAAGTSHPLAEIQPHGISREGEKRRIWAKRHCGSPAGQAGSAECTADRQGRSTEALPAAASSAGSMLTDLHLDEGCLVGQGSGDHARVAEARPQERGHGEEEEDCCEHGDGRGQLDGQVPAPAGRCWLA